jgi:hypothetical protein
MCRLSESGKVHVCVSVCSHRESDPKENEEGIYTRVD